MTTMNKGAIITGSSQGLGYEIAKKLVGDGFDVLICARNQEELNKASENLNSICHEGQTVIRVPCDVSQIEQVEMLFKEAEENLPYYNVLVNNAGVYGPMGLLEDVDWDEWTRAFEINVYGTVYPCKLAVKHLKKLGGGRIINISGGGATNPLPRISSYAASKAAIVRFTETLAQEVSQDNITVNAVAPGALNTRMMDQLIAAGPKNVGEAMYERMAKIAKDGGTPLEVGASLCAYLASTNVTSITGRLISAVWDPWKEFEKYSDDIASSDIYTLRRIVASERGKSWESK